MICLLYNLKVDSDDKAWYVKQLDLAAVRRKTHRTIRNLPQVSKTQTLFKFNFYVDQLRSLTFYE